MTCGMFAGIQMLLAVVGAVRLAVVPKRMNVSTSDTIQYRTAVRLTAEAVEVAVPLTVSCPAEPVVALTLSA